MMPPAPFGEEHTKGILEWMHAWAVFMVARDRLQDDAVRRAAAAMPALLKLLEEMKASMDSIAEKLELVERRWMRKQQQESTEEEVLLCLLRRAEAASYGIWDMVHDIHIQANNKQLGAAAAATKMARKASTDNEMMREINEELREICRELDYSFRSDSSFPSDGDADGDNVLARHKLLDEHWVDPNQILGREKDVQSILDLLLSSPARGGGEEEEGGPIFLPIFGLAGVGKTALAQLLFSHTRCRDYYDARVWADFTDQFHLRVAACCRSSAKEEYAHGPPDMLESIMQRLYLQLGAARRKVLVVLDMICDEVNNLDSLKCMLDAGNQGIKVTVIVVTRDEDIARTICTKTNNRVQPYKLLPLSDDLCWQIIKQQTTGVFQSPTDDEQEILEEIGPEIAAKCGGIPLAARQVGARRRGATSIQDWQSFKDSLSSWHHVDFCIKHLSEVMFSLIRSYQSMPPDMRLCFAHLAATSLPEMMMGDKDDIIHGWMALGFIKPWDGTSTGYQRGEEIISRLSDISFLQPDDDGDSASAGGNKGVISFTMNSLVHSFARFVLSSRLLFLDGENQIPSDIHGCRYALLTRNFDVASPKLSAVLPPELRSLSLLYYGETELPDSICQLRFLRYLNLSGCYPLENLPESLFGNLMNLVHLNLSRCRCLKNLPESLFGNVMNVVHLNLSGCYSLKNLPESLFGNLMNLVHLNLSGCDFLQNLPESLFGNLMNLVHLNLSGHRLENLPESLFGNLVNLVHLDLSGCLFLENLPESLFGNLMNLVHLNLSRCRCLKNLPESLFGNLMNLVHLNLSGCLRLENLPESLFGNLMNLVHLNLSGCRDLQNLPESIGGLINVKYMDLSGCLGLNMLPESFSKLSKLEYLDLSLCSWFRELPTTVAALSNLRHLNLSHLRCDNVERRSHVERLKEVWAKLTKLEYLNLAMLINVPTPFCSQSQQAGGESFDWVHCIQCLSNLEHLDLSHDIYLVDLPESLAGLSRLRTLDVTGCIRLDMTTAEKLLAEMGRLKIIVVKEHHPIRLYTMRNISIAEVEGMLGTAVFVGARNRFFVPPGDPDLKDMVDRISRVLEQAMRQQPSMEVQLPYSLLRKVEAAAYDIWDMVVVDEIQQGNELQGAAGGIMARMLPCPVVIAPKLAKSKKMMSKLKDDLRKISQELESFRFTVDIADTVLRITDGSSDTENTIGREEDVQRILDLLLLSSPTATASSSRDRDQEEEEGPVFLPIFGLAGVGKAALAHLLFDHDRCREYYDARVWATVPDHFDFWRICTDIISQLKMAYGDDNDMQSVKRRLADVLGGGKKVLIVLDSIWEHHLPQLDNLCRVLGVCNQGGGISKVTVLVTTRDEGVARRVVTTVQPYKLHPLSDDLCWQIIKRKASRVFDEGRTTERELLEKIGREIAAKCSGIPLAAQEAVDELYWNGSSVEWQQFRDTCQEKDFPDLQLRGMFSSLSLSYERMPPDMRLCFAHLATSFPDRSRRHMDKDAIIHRWIALGFIKPYGGFSARRRQRGEQIISRLLDISFLQRANSTSDDSTAVCFTMHVLVHGLARVVSWRNSICLDGRDSSQQFSKNHSYRHAALTNCISPQHLSGILSAHLRVLLCHGCSNKLFSGVSFSSAKYLRVLDLIDCGLEKLPDSIYQLRQLRYLNLSCSSRLVKLHDSFGNLLNLGYINLSGCSGLLELPASFGRLKNVVHVNLSSCSGLLELPASFGNLTNVVHVNLSGCVGLKTLPESFGRLEKLEHLDLSSCSCLEGIPSALVCLTNLQHLNLSHPCSYLAEHRSYLEVPKHVWEKLTKLRYLNLSMCLNPIFCYKKEKERNEYIESISCLTSLEHLDLSHNVFLFDIPESLGQLSQLQTLNLSGCVRLKRIDRWMGDKKSLVMSNCLGLQRYEFVVQADGGAGSRIRSNLAELKDVSCKEVEISCLEKVTSTEEAQSIRLVDKKKLQKLTLVWSEACDDVSGVSLKDDALLAELVPPQNLQCFELHGYSSKSLPDWLTSSSIFSYLPNLVEIAMVDIPICSSLPPFGALPNLQRLVLRRVVKVTRIDAAGHLSGGSSNAGAFQRLLHVTLDGMVSLEEIAIFPTLDELVVNSCPKLRWSGGSPPKSRMLVISDCNHLMVSPVLVKRGEHQDARVTEVVIESCKVPLDESKWSLLKGLAPLHRLYLRDCSEKVISENIMKDTLLSSLWLLSFSHCDSMTYLPEHVVQDTYPRELVIHECCGIKSLPKRISEKNKVPYPLVRIRGCPELKKWCESEENKRNLNHIEFKFEESVGTSEAEITAHGQRQIEPTSSFAEKGTAVDDDSTRRMIRRSSRSRPAMEE